MFQSFVCYVDASMISSAAVPNKPIQNDVARGSEAGEEDSWDAG